MNIDKERILTEAENDFIKASSDTKFVNPYVAGRMAGKHRILSELAKAYDVVTPALLPDEGRQLAWELWMEFERKRQNER
jgi:hypothetical protein